MTEDDRQAFAEALAICGEVYGKPVPVSRARAFFRVLEGFPLDMVLRAISLHMERCRFFPVPAELIELIKGDDESAAAAAWSEVIRLARNSRAAHSKDPITEQVIRELGGWVHLGRQPENQLHWLQRKFVSRYQQLAEAVPSEHRLLTGPAAKRITGVPSGRNSIEGKKNGHCWNSAQNIHELRIRH